jgi:apolipoprotein N-acyltransferase
MSDIKANLARAAACLASGGLLAITGSLHPLWPAGWIAATPVLAAAFLSRRWTGFGLAFLAALIGEAPLFGYLLGVAPPPIAAVTVALLALAFAGGVALAASARRRLPAAVAVFAFPAWMAGLYTAIDHLSPHGASANPAFSQMGFTPVLQVAALGGAPAIVFLTSLFASGLAFAAVDARAPRRALAAAGPAAFVVAAGLSFGVFRLAAAPAQPGVTVALAALDFEHQLPQAWRPVVDAYRPRMAQAQAAGARILVLPEEIAAIAAADVPAMRAELGGWAHGSGVALAVGFRVQEGAKAFNRLFVFAPDGRVTTYDKRHLIPGLESGELTAGRGPVMSTRLDGLRLGGSICKDFDFVDTTRALAADRDQLVLAPAWDFGVDAWLHGRMAVLDGVEGGFTLVRSARRGVMSVSDRYGRVLAEAPSGADAPLLTTSAPIPSAGPTLYARIGDLFGWACALLALGLEGLVLFARRR